MWPALRSIMPGSTAWTSRKTLLTLMRQQFVPRIGIAVDDVAREYRARIGQQDVDPAEAARAFP